MKFKLLQNYFRYFILIIIIFGLIFAGINIFVYATGKKFIKTITELNQSDAILLPGASVKSSGLLSAIYKERADMAAQLYAIGKAPAILVSGDNKEINYNEVTPAVTYLTKEKGIPPSDIFSDYAGFDTYNSVYRAKEIFEIKSVIIVSQTEYLPRALYLAKEIGIKAQGISAGNDVSVLGWIRERFASIKAFFDAITRHESKFLGEKIPIPR